MVLQNTFGANRRAVLKFMSGMLAVSTLPALNFPASAATSNKAASEAQSATVYFSKAITGDAVLALYERAGKDVITGKTLIKLHVGEPGNTNFLSPDLVRQLALRLHATLGDSNVYYGGARATTESHQAVAKLHGFDFVPFDVLDADGSVDLPIPGGKRLHSAKMGSHVLNYDSIIVLTHFKGHGMAGFGGAIKNLAMGIASKEGKEVIHGAGFKYRGKEFLERLTEYGKSLTTARAGHLLYINVINKLSVDCDCDANAKPPTLADIGIAASTDIVAIEQACFDMVKKASGAKGSDLTHRIAEREGEHQILYAEQMGMGTSKYHLVEI